MTGQEARDDEDQLAKALFRTLFLADVPFHSATLIPQLTATILAAGYRKHPEPEWEYGVRDVGSRDVFTDVYESVEDMIDDFDGAVAVQPGEEMVKRQKAGPWVPVGEGEQ